MKHVNKGEAEWADYAELDRLFSSLEAEALLLEW